MIAEWCYMKTSRLPSSIKYRRIVRYKNYDANILLETTDSEGASMFSSRQEHVLKLIYPPRHTENYIYNNIDLNNVSVWIIFYMQDCDKKEFKSKHQSNL